jgi:hypothetical protein
MMTVAKARHAGVIVSRLKELTKVSSIQIHYLLETLTLASLIIKR